MIQVTGFIDKRIIITLEDGKQFKGVLFGTCDEEDSGIGEEAIEMSSEFGHFVMTLPIKEIVSIEEIK